MFFLLFLLLLSWPVIEIAIFVQIGQSIGWVAAILLTIVTAIAGAFLMRIQGFRAMARFLEGAQKGELPVAAVLDGMGIFTAGLFLLLPGFISDFFGILLFIPPLRRWLTGWVFRQVLQGKPAGQRPRSSPLRPRGEPQTAGMRKSDNVVDAEFESIEPERPDKPDSLTGKPQNGKPGPVDPSPWRGRTTE